jgi:hypothetical protein
MYLTNIVTLMALQWKRAANKQSQRAWDAGTRSDAYAISTGCRRGPQEHLQIGDAKFDLNCIFTLPLHMMRSGRHLQYARNNFDRRIPPSDSYGCNTESDTTRHDTPRGDQERMALGGWIGCGGAAKQQGIQSRTINRRMATDHQLCSPCSRMSQVWAMIYWMTMNVEKEHNQLGL